MNFYTFLDCLKKRFKQLNPKKKFLILGGDFNVDPSKHLNKLCCSTQEQERFAEILKLGLIDGLSIGKKVTVKENTSLQLDHFLFSANKVSKISRISKYSKTKKERRK